MSLNPEHLQDPLFARCYQRWQAQPESAAFVGVADVLRVRGAYQEAIQVCREGLRHNPQLVTGRLVLAQCLDALGCRADAFATVLGILADAPNHAEAKAIAERLHPTPPMTRPMSMEDSPPPPPPLPERERVKIVAPVASELSTEASTDIVLLETVTMARLYAAQGHRREAERVCRAILKRNPTNADARAELEKLQA